MKIKALFYWFCNQVRNYNLFIPDENEYDDVPRDPAIALKHQKHTTWLYILLLITFLYIVSYTALTKREDQTIVISDVTLSVFEQRSLKYGKTLLCPCSKSTVPYKKFVSHNIIWNSVCSSIFVTPQWIEALYLKDASTYGVGDFRTTANSQFKLLASLCSLSQDTVLQNQVNFDNNDFVTVNLLSDAKVELEVNATFDFLKISASTQIMSFLNYTKTIFKANYLISALNTNMLVGVHDAGDDMSLQYAMETKYDLPNATCLFMVPAMKMCGKDNPTTAAIFDSLSDNWKQCEHEYWKEPTSDSTFVNGFFAACTPLEALLESTLDCLYDIKCLQLLSDYFPSVKQMHLNWTDSILHDQQQNISVEDHLLHLFTDEWSTKMNYSKYFDECAPSVCTYTTTDQTNIFYAVTLFISLYGGLIIILRLIAPFLIDVAWKIKHYSINTNVNFVSCNICVHKFVAWMKHLNLFKEANERTENNIKQQKMITRVYCILLTGSLFVLILFHSLSTQMATITVRNPSLGEYNNLQSLYSSALECPCSTMTIPYNAFISLSPTLHEVCSSDFIDDGWISSLKKIMAYDDPNDWSSLAYSQFQLISDLCQLANETIDDAVHRFSLQSFVASSVINETDFYTQLNVTLDQFVLSMIADFSLLIDTVNLLIQVDQPYMGTLQNFMGFFNSNLIENKVTNGIGNQQSLQFTFSLVGTRSINSTLVDCICAINPHCQSPSAIEYGDNSRAFNNNQRRSYTIRGWIKGCSPIHSLLPSTLECFYSKSDCFLNILIHIRERHLDPFAGIFQFDAHPLVYDSTVSRFPPNTSMGTIVKKVMIEQWNPSPSYHQFYDSCAPSHCIYSQKVRAKDIVEVMLALASMIGGLTFSLRLITPHLVKIMLRLWKFIMKRQEQPEQQEQQEQGNR